MKGLGFIGQHEVSTRGDLFAVRWALLGFFQEGDNVDLGSFRILECQLPLDEKLCYSLLFASLELRIWFNYDQVQVSDIFSYTGAPRRIEVIFMACR